MTYPWLIIVRETENWCKYLFVVLMYLAECFLLLLCQFAFESLPCNLFHILLLHEMDEVNKLIPKGKVRLDDPTD